MPNVRIEMFPGRSQLQKELMARAVVDAVAESSGCSREIVQVVFDEISRSNWAIGPRLASSPSFQPSTERERAPAVVSLDRLRVRPGRLDEFLEWQRSSALPFMASHEGFVSSTLLSSDEDPDELVVVTKWASRAARAQYLAGLRDAALASEARELLERDLTGDFGGTVVDVLNRRAAVRAPASEENNERRST